MILRYTMLSAMGLAAIAGLAIALSSESGPVSVAPVAAEAPAAPDESWAETLARAPRLTVTAFVTGWVEAGPEILLDPRDPRFPESERHRRWVPSIAYLVEHEGEKPVVLDTGVRSGDCAYGTPPLYWVPCRATPGGDLTARLRERGLEASDLKLVVVSHFHGDHVSGLDPLQEKTSVPVLTTRAEAIALQSWWRMLSGYEDELMRRPLNLRTIDGGFVSRPAAIRAFDLYGDGSLWLIATPGHSAGHISALVNAAPAPLLLTFDAAHLKYGFDHRIPPGAFVDREKALASLDALYRLRDAIPGVRVIYGHEPSQWQEESPVVSLSGAGAG